MLSAGMFLGGRYEVIGRIGSGGMSDVYKGKDTKLNRFVAIKVLKQEFREDKNFVRKFQVEAQSAAGLIHPNIVGVYDVGEEDGLYYIVMELVEGITLKEYVEKKGRLEAKEAISIAIQVSLGIEVAHNNQIIHRDIKPQNIIISKEGKVKVTDFGIARAASSNTISSNAMGSVHYTSPEQARGGYSDAKSDIYSLGISMYEMVTGRVPFDGDTTVAIAIKHLQEEIVPPSFFAEDIPYSLEQIILKCTQKSPDRRYMNMAEVISDLKQSLVNPDGDFVKLIPLNQSGATKLISEDELDKIKGGTIQLFPDDIDDDDDEEDLAEGFDDGDEAVNPKVERVMKILSIVVGVIILCIILFMIGRAAGIFKFGPTTKKEETQKEEDSKKVVMPEIVGMDEQEASETLSKLGLGMKVTERKTSDKYEQGQVMTQDPEYGDKVDKNTTVRVTVSSGKEEDTVKVPDNLKGKSQSEAERALKAAGLKVNPQYKHDDSVENGYVISSNPESGTVLGKGQTVTIYVSTGEETAVVPSLRGKTEEQARKALKDAGLTSGTVRSANSDSVPKGQVIEQGTGAGQEVSKGSAVDFVVSKGPEEPEQTTTQREVWKCNCDVTLPGDYQGGTVIVEVFQGDQLLKRIDGAKVMTRNGNKYVNVSVEGKAGVSKGKLFVYEMVDGELTELGSNENITFKKAN